MIKFFTSEDFKEVGAHPDFAKDLAITANKKLEREGKVIYFDKSELKDEWFSASFEPANSDDMKALLINIEPLTKCKHEKEKVTTGRQQLCKHKDIWSNPYFICECGAKVKPTSFEEIE